MGGIPAEMRKAQIEDQISAASPEAKALYAECIANGSTMEWAAMCALRAPPGTGNTDRAFCQGANSRMNSMSPRNRDAIVKIAQKAGISTQGKFYHGRLGRYTDPAAWLSSADDLLAVAKEKNLFVDGVIRHNGVVVDPPKNQKKPKLAPDLVQYGVNRLLKAEPDTAAKVKEKPRLMRQVVERVIDKHSKKK